MGSSEKGKGLAEGRRGRSAEPPEVSVALDMTNERLLILRRSPPLTTGWGGWRRSSEAAVGHLQTPDSKTLTRSAGQRVPTPATKAR